METGSGATVESALPRNVILAGVALIGMLIAVHGYEARRSYRDALAYSAAAARSLSVVLADETAWRILAIEPALEEVSTSANHSSAATNTPVGAQALLRERVGHVPVIHSAAIVGADGRVRASIGAAQWNPDWSTSDALVHAAHAAPGSLYFENATVGAGADTAALQISRGLFDPDGSFAGIVVARVVLSYFGELYAALNAAPDVVVRVIRDDGAVLSSFPATVPGALHNAGADERMTLVRSPIWPRPLTIEVTAPMNRVVAKWRHDEWAGIARTSAIVIFTATLLAALIVALRRQERADRRRRRLEKQWRQTVQAESLGMFAASITHDFNNVLSAIVGYGELALEALPEESPARIQIQRLLTASDRARQLVRRVLTFDLRRGTRNALLDIGPILREVLDQIRAMLPAGIAIRIQDSQALPAIHGDATEVHQVIMNICSNAVRAMPDGGNLEVVVENVMIRRRQSAAVGELIPGPWVRLSITDSGVGMPPALLAMIFEPFSSTKAVEQGTGIGLAVVRNIVGSMRGAITVDSEVGVGSTFRVHWPAVAPEETARASDAVVAAPGRGQIVMIVDDDQTLVEITEELLAALGYEPVGFTDPARALEALRQNPAYYDVLISDQQMSNTMRGTDLARAAREVCGDLPIVLITGHRDANLKARAEAAGVREILDKPLRSEQLRDVLARILAARSRPR